MASKRTRITEVDDKDLDAALVSLVSRCSDGLKIDRARAMLPAPYKVSKSRIEKRLDQLAAERKIHRWSKQVVAPEAFAIRARAALLQAIDDAPRVKTQIRKRLPETMRGSTLEIEPILESLIADGAIFEHPDPKKKSTKRYARTPADPKPYVKSLRKTIDALAKQLARAGIDRAALIAALSDQPQPARSTPRTNGVEPDALMSAVLEIRPDAREHVLVSIRDLRRHLRWPKTDFDRTVLDLARQGRITLHHHDHPHGLDPADREDLVRDDHGNYYVGLVLEEAA